MELKNITPDYIREKMFELRLKQVDLVGLTGCDKTNINAWVNGTRGMSQPVKAMFHYCFEYVRLTGRKSHK